MDVQTEQQAVIKFFLCLKKPMPYILARLMNTYTDEAPKPFTIKNDTNFVSDNEVVNAADTFFNLSTEMISRNLLWSNGLSA